MPRRVTYSIAAASFCFLAALITGHDWKNGLIQALLGGGLFFVLDGEKE